MELIDLAMCLTCRNIDVKDRLVPTYCEITDTKGYDHVECIQKDWEQFHSESGS